MIYDIHLSDFLPYLSWHLIWFASKTKHAYLTSEMDKMENQKLQNLSAVLIQPVAQYTSLSRLTYWPLTVAMVATNLLIYHGEAKWLSS